MGRPLYSRAFSTTPVVRDPEPPSCERWSYLNAFDPDSDEFFDNENAVFEDFIGPVTSVDPEVDEDSDEDEEEREMLVVRMGNASPITSESSLSDNEDPVDALRSPRQMDDGESEPAVRVRLATRALPSEPRWESQTRETERPRDSRPRRQIGMRGAFRGGSYHSYSPRDEPFSLPTPSAPIPVPAVSRRSGMVDERAFSSPSTPPRQTPAAHLSMSPPPTSTPRLYTWARSSSHTASPSSGSPFTNPYARTSYAHLSPALVRIRDVAV